LAELAGIQTIDPDVTATLVAMGVGLLMVHAGIGKRLLSRRGAAERWRPRRRKAGRPRTPRR
jgi:hypothetical protein